MAVYDSGADAAGTSRDRAQRTAVAYIVGKAVLAVGLWGAAAIGYLRGPLALPERIFAFAAAGLLVAALPVTDELGFGASLLFLAWHFVRTRRVAQPA